MRSIGNTSKPRYPLAALRPALLLLVATGLVAALPLHAQDRGNPDGEWRYWGADAWTTRYSALDQIDAGNFDDLQTAWVWRADNFGPTVDFIYRATPIYADGMLYTVAGRSRSAVAIDPATGETLWIFREPRTTRWERSSRQSHGKGVAYGEVDGRGVVYHVTPAFFLHALDAKTGLPLEGFGRPVPLPGFEEHGTVDMLADLGHPYDPDYGIPDSIGYITNTSPPIVVNGVVVVGNSNLQGNLETRMENVPGDVLAYDARTGEHLWTFNVIPGEGEIENETWESDAWQWSGNINTGPHCRPTPSAGSSTSRPTPRPTTTTEASVRETTSSATASWLSTCGRASASGTSRVCTTTSGTGISRCPLNSSTSPSTGVGSRRWCRVRNSPTSTRSTGRRASRSGRSRNGPHHRRRCRASSSPRPNRTRRGRFRTAARVGRAGNRGRS